MKDILKIYLGDIATRNAVDNTFALRIMFKKMAESVKQPMSFTRIVNIVSSTGAKVGTNTIINVIDRFFRRTRSGGTFYYMLTNQHHKVLYTGVTTNLQQRVLQHKSGVYKCVFTKKYRAHKLVHFVIPINYFTFASDKFKHIYITLIWISTIYYHL